MIIFTIRTLLLTSTVQFPLNNFVASVLAAKRLSATTFRGLPIIWTTYTCLTSIHIHLLCLHLCLDWSFRVRRSSHETNYAPLVLSLQDFRWVRPCCSETLSLSLVLIVICIYLSLLVNEVSLVVSVGSILCVYARLCSIGVFALGDP